MRYSRSRIEIEGQHGAKVKYNYWKMANKDREGDWEFYYTAVGMWENRATETTGFIIIYYFIYVRLKKDRLHFVSNSPIESTHAYFSFLLMYVYLLFADGRRRVNARGKMQLALDQTD